MRNAFVRTLSSIARRDSRVFLLTGDLGFSVFEDFAAEFPDRFVNVGVAEQNLVGVATGLALSGKVAFTYSIASFMTLRCTEQIRNDVCHHHANVKIVGVGAGLAYGTLGCTHHAVQDLAITRAMPHMTVVSPADAVETELAVEALASFAGPAYLRLGKAGEPAVHSARPPFVLGKAITVRDGEDVAIIGTGGLVYEAIRAAEALAGNGVSTRVVSMHTLKPMDAEAISAAARECRVVVTVEEHVATGGLGSAVAEVMAGLESPRAILRRLNVREEALHVVGSQGYLLRLNGLDRDRIAQVALEAVGLPAGVSPSTVAARS